MEPLIIDNKKIFDLISINQKHQKKIDEVLDEMDKLTKNLDELSVKKQEVRNEMQKLVAEAIGKQEEFIIVASVVKKDDKVQVNLIDLVDEYKKQLRKTYEQGNVSKTQDDDAGGEVKEEVDTKGDI